MYCPGRSLPVGLLTCPDRTSELRKKGFEGRRLGPKQMTTDTAVRVTRLVVQDRSESIPCRVVGCLATGHALLTWPVPLDKVPHVDFPELKFNEHESTEMPFRYVVDESGNPIMPPVSPIRLRIGLAAACANHLLGYERVDTKGCRQGSKRPILDRAFEYAYYLPRRFFRCRRLRAYEGPAGRRQSLPDGLHG